MKRFSDRLMGFLVRGAGITVLLTVFAMLYYLASEARFAFDRTHPYGFRFAARTLDAPQDYSIATDPNASFIGAHPDGSDGLDEKEEGITMPTVDAPGEMPVATGTALTGDQSAVDTTSLYRDDWRAPKKAGKGDEYLLFVYGCPGLRDDKMVLAWEPDVDFVPRRSPYKLQLELVSGPAGVKVAPISIDLKNKPSGSIELPAFVASTDADRTNAYVFKVRAIPTTNNLLATIGGVFSTDWAPTTNYSRFGLFPLLSGTLLVTVLSVLLAAPPSIWLALYLSEVAHSRVREVLKPIVELLASVPTVVLGFFGLMLVAPALQATFASAFRMESGRSLITAAVVMAILLIPTIATVTEDALRNVPESVRDGGEALGLTSRESLKTIILPAAKSGLIGALLLGLARAVGETMVVWMLGGGTAHMPALTGPAGPLSNLFQSMRGIPDTIAVEMGNVSFESPHYGHLFLLGLVLFVITLATNLVGYKLARRSAWN